MDVNIPFHSKHLIISQSRSESSNNPFVVTVSDNRLHIKTAQGSSNGLLRITIRLNNSIWWEASIKGGNENYKSVQHQAHCDKTEAWMENGFSVYDVLSLAFEWSALEIKTQAEATLEIWGEDAVITEGPPWGFGFGSSHRQRFPMTKPPEVIQERAIWGNFLRYVLDLSSFQWSTTHFSSPPSHHPVLSSPFWCRWPVLLWPLENLLCFVFVRTATSPVSDWCH